MSQSGSKRGLCFEALASNRGVCIPGASLPAFLKSRAEDQVAVVIFSDLVDVALFKNVSTIFFSIGNKVA